jgi:TldD protein
VSLIDQVSSQLLSVDDLNLNALENVLGNTLVAQVDYADIYMQSSYEESWILDEGLVKRADFDVSTGFGMRVISGSKTGFAYADNISKAALIDAASSAKSIVRSGQGACVKVAGINLPPKLYTAANPLLSLQDKEKVDLLKRIDSYARSKDSRVSQVTASLSASYDNILILNSNGQWSADVRPLVSLQISIVVKDKDKQEVGRAGGGGRTDYSHFLDNELAMQYVDTAIAQALVNCSAIQAPAGVMPVVLGPGLPAVLLHEAVGHGLEADFNRKGSSVYSNSMGEKVASSLCTIVDDGTIAHRRGSLTIDDEGVGSQNTVLIENGYLKGYMYDRQSALLMGKESTGNGRRESYSSVVMPRMTNTYMLPGESDPGEIVASVENGIYAVDFSGGEVDITSGQFVFTASEAYLIENGKITHPISNATLIGNGSDVLQKISMVGNDLALDNGQGMCGKEGQSVEVGVGQPTLKIDSMTVGGSNC